MGKSNMKNKSVPVPAEPPDGGFGWVIVLAGFLHHVLILGLAYTIGVYYTAFQDPDDLGADISTLAWVATAHLCMFFGSGPLAGYMLSKMSTLRVGFIGSIAAGGGCIAAAFSPNIYLVIVSLGLVAGIGTDLMFMADVTAISRWFSKKRSLATGLALSGAGVGIFLFSPLIRLMLNEWGRSGALLIEGALLFNGCVISLLLRPVPSNRRKNVIFNMGDNSSKASLPLIYNGRKHNAGLTEETNELEELQPSSEAEKLEVTQSDPTNLVTKSRHITSTSQMWRDANYWLFVVSQMIAFLSASAPLVYLYSRAELDLHISPIEASFVVSVMGIFNTLGRVAFGALGNALPRFRLFILAGAIITFGAATIVCTWGYSYISIAAFAAVFGSCYGCLLVLTSVVVVDLFGLTLFQAIFGNVGMFRGVAIISSPPLYGWLIRTAGGQHSLLFIVTGVLGVIAGCCLLLIPISDRFRSRRNK